MGRKSAEMAEKMKSWAFVKTDICLSPGSMGIRPAQSQIQMGEMSCITYEADEYYSRVHASKLKGAQNS